MSKRDRVLLIRKIQFVILIGAVIGGIGIIVNSPLGDAVMAGTSNRVLFATAGMALLVVVAFAGSKLLFSNLPHEYAPDDDAVTRAEGNASAKVLGGLAEMKYAKKKRGKAPSFEEAYGFKKN